MKIPSREEVEYVRKSYPVGCKVEVDFMDDVHAIPSGSVCTVSHVDDMAQVHVEEFGLALIYGVDKFHKI